MIDVLLLGNISKGKLIDRQQFIDETNMNEKLISNCDIASWSKKKKK